MKKELAALIAILLITFAIRVGSLSDVCKTDPLRVTREDSESYEGPALAIMADHQFSSFPVGPMNARFLHQISNEGTSIASAPPEVLRTPGYPIFIATVYSLLGKDLFFGLLAHVYQGTDYWRILGKVRFSQLLPQVLVSIGTLGLIFAMGKVLWNSRVAILATALLALDPISFLYSQQILTETLFTFFFVAGLYCGALWILGRRSLWMALLMTFCFLAATFVRPVTYYLVIPLAIGFLWLTLRNPQSAFKNVRAEARTPNNSAFRIPHSALLLAILLLPWVLLVGGWQVRNYKLTGRSEFSFIQSYNMLWYRGAGIVALRDHITIEQAREKITKTLPDLKNMSMAEQHALYQREGLALIKKYPLLCLRTQISGAVAMLFGPGGAAMNEFFGVKSKAVKLGLLAWQAGYLALIYGGMLLGGIGWLLGKGVISGKDAASTKYHAYLFIWGAVVYLIVVSAGPEAYSRFRAPIIPVFALFAARGFYLLSSKLKRRQGADRDVREAAHV